MDDLNKSFLDVEFSEDMPKAIMPDSVKCLLEIDEVVAEVALVLEMFLNKYPAVENLLGGTPTCSETCLFFR